MSDDGKGSLTILLLFQSLFNFSATASAPSEATPWSFSVFIQLPIVYLVRSTFSLAQIFYELRKQLHIFPVLIEKGKGAPIDVQQSEAQRSKTDIQSHKGIRTQNDSLH